MVRLIHGKMSENVRSANCFFPLPFLITFKARKFRSARELLLPVPKVGLENFRCFSSERRRRSSDNGSWSAKRCARRFRVTMSSSSVLLKKKISTPFDFSSVSTIVRLVCKISLNDAYLIRCNRRTNNLKAVAREKRWGDLTVPLLSCSFRRSAQWSFGCLRRKAIPVVYIGGRRLGEAQVTVAAVLPQTHRVRFTVGDKFRSSRWNRAKACCTWNPLETSKDWSFFNSFIWSGRSLSKILFTVSIRIVTRVLKRKRSSEKTPNWNAKTLDSQWNFRQCQTSSTTTILNDSSPGFILN